MADRDVADRDVADRDVADRGGGRTLPSSDDDRSAVDWIAHVTRIGWLAKGFVFVVIGGIAVRVAIAGGRGDSVDRSRPARSADQRGALRAISDTPIGSLLLIVLAAGLAVFAVWKVTQAVIPSSADRDVLGALRRIGWAGLGVFYGALGIAAWNLGRGERPSDEQSTAELTARLMGAPGGRLLVGVVAVIVAAVAAFHVRKGVRYEFVDDLDTDDLSTRTERWIGRAGVAGFVARAIVLGVAAWFLLRSAIRFDPSEAVGLDGALRELAAADLGRGVLLAVGLGLAIAGCYDMATFRRQTMR